MLLIIPLELSQLGSNSLRVQASLHLVNLSQHHQLRVHCARSLELFSSLVPFRLRELALVSLFFLVSRFVLVSLSPSRSLPGFPLRCPGAHLELEDWR